jgi:hypothetical protein
VSDQPKISDHAECGSNAWKPVHCDRCGRDFVCTPWDDFYCAAEGDHCCERCLIGPLKLTVMPASEIQPARAGNGDGSA